MELQILQVQENTFQTPCEVVDIWLQSVKDKECQATPQNSNEAH